VTFFPGNAEYCVHKFIIFLYLVKHTDKRIEFRVLEDLSQSLRKGPKLLLVSGP
jgi:hypothetical protein